MIRYGQRLGLRPEQYSEYKRLHGRIWPEIAAAITAAGIRNYSIFHLPAVPGRDAPGELFAYFEYVGPPGEYAARMQALAAAPRMREWWDLMEPMQVPHPVSRPGQWWTTMEQLFHQD